METPALLEPCLRGAGSEVNPRPGLSDPRNQDPQIREQLQRQGHPCAPPQTLSQILQGEAKTLTC